MELRHLRYFVTVAEELSFSRAAIRLYISQPPLSRQIKNLEDELKVLLFCRQSDGLKLTQAGTIFLEQAKDILQRSDAAMQSIKNYSINTDEPLVIGYISTVLNSFLEETLHRFSIDYPQVGINLREMCPSEQIKALRDGKIHIAFMGNPPDELEKEFIVKCVKQVPVDAVLPHTHPLANQRTIDLRELTAEKFIGICEQTYPNQNHLISDVCRKAGFQPNLYLFADTYPSMIALIAARQGVAVMPRETETIHHRKVVFMRLHHPICYARSTAVWRKETPAKSLDKFIKILFDSVESYNLDSTLSSIVQVNFI